MDKHTPALEVTGSSSQQDIVGMPVQAEDGGTDWLLDVLAHPPAGNNTVCKEVSGMNSQKAAILENLTSHFPAQSNRWR